MSEKPHPYPAMPKGNRWEVQLPPGEWKPCDSEDDARTISVSPVLEYEICDENRKGEKAASDCERTAKVLEKYGFGPRSRYFRSLAERARGQKGTG